MKIKLVTFLMIFLFGSFSTSAQTEKGNWFLSGLKVLTFQTGTVKQNGAKEDITDFIFGPSFLNSNPSLVFAPTINYCFSNTWSGGIFVNFNFDSHSYKEIDGSESSASIFGIGPTVRYTFVNNSKFKPFADAKIGIGSIVLKQGDNISLKESVFEWYLGTGCTYFIKPKVGIDFSLGYRNMVTKDKNLTVNVKTIYSLMNLGIGMVVGF